MNVKKAVILARGLGSRMRAAAPGAQLSKEQAKAADAGVKGMIDVGRPFLDFVASALADVGITDVCLVIGPEHDVIRNHYGSIATERVRFHFAIQQEPLGTANAVAAAEEFAAGERFVVLNSDNYYPAHALGKLIEAPGAAAIGFEREGLIKHSNIPAQRIASFGIMISRPIEGVNARVMTTMIEKPEPQVLAANPDALISMNAWLFTAEIFNAIRSIDLSPRGEYEITDAVRSFVESGNEMRVIPVNSGVLDMSRRDDIAKVAQALQDVKVVL